MNGKALQRNAFQSSSKQIGLGFGNRTFADGFSINCIAGQGIAWHGIAAQSTSD
jgi:hypothetical protein